MGLFGTQEPYDRDNDGRLDAGEWELWEQGFHHPEPQSEEIELTCTLDFQTDLIEGWETMKTALWSLPLQSAPLQPMLGRSLIRSILQGICQASEPVPGEKWHALDQFLKYADDLGAEWTVGGLIAQAETGTLPYALESELTENSCGRLWACLLPCITQDGIPQPLSDICWELCCACIWFQGGTLDDAVRISASMEESLLDKSPVFSGSF